MDYQRAMHCIFYTREIQSRDISRQTHSEHSQNIFSNMTMDLSLKFELVLENKTDLFREIDEGVCLRFKFTK